MLSLEVFMVKKNDIVEIVIDEVLFPNKGR